MARRPKPPPSDPYKTLGIAPTADAGTVKRAYRKRARATHPDAGGDAEAFHAVNRAYAVLSDPVKRLTYDRTGEVDDGVQNPDAEAMALIANLVEQLAEKDVDAWYEDAVAAMRRTLERGRGQVEEELGKRRRQVKRVERLATRFKAKQGDNIVRRMIEKKAQSMHAAIAGGESSLAAMKRALELLEHLSFDCDPAPKRDSLFVGRWATLEGLS